MALKLPNLLRQKGDLRGSIRWHFWPQKRLIGLAKWMLNFMFNPCTELIQPNVWSQNHDRIELYIEWYIEWYRNYRTLAGPKMEYTMVQQLDDHQTRQAITIGSFKAEEGPAYLHLVGNLWGSVNSSANISDLYPSRIKSGNGKPPNWRFWWAHHQMYDLSTQP